MPPHNVESEAEFNKMVASGVSVVDFYAPWCGACKKFMPDFDDLCTKYPGIKFLKIDVDELEDLAATHDVNGLPYLAVFSGSKLVQRISGKDVVRNVLESALEKHNDAAPAPAAPAAAAAAPAPAAAAAAPAKAEAAGSGSVTTIDDESFEFKDPNSGNTVRFTVEHKMSFSVNGEPRPPFDKMLSDGANKVAFPSIGKAVTLPDEGREAILSKLLSLAETAHVATEGFTVKIPAVDVSYFSFVDPKSGNTLAFYADVAAKKVVYSVNGEPRPGFTQVASDGFDRVSFTDIGKGCSLPKMNLHVHIGSLLSLVEKVGGTASGFPKEVTL